MKKTDIVIIMLLAVSILLFPQVTTSGFITTQDPIQSSQIEPQDISLDSFVSRWNTSMNGETNSSQIKLPIYADQKTY